MDVAMMVHWLVKPPLEHFGHPRFSIFELIVANEGWVWLENNHEVAAA